MLLTKDERTVVLQSGLLAKYKRAKEFVQFDLFYDRRVAEKFFAFTVIVPAPDSRAPAYIARPENRILISQVGNDGLRGAPDATWLLGPASMPEMTGAVKATTIANFSRYRFDVSMRMDAIMEVKPEEGMWIVNDIDELSKSNTMGLIFPMYVADKYLSDVARTKDLNESNWTMMVQSFMNATGQVGEYGKYMHKEEYELNYGIAPLSRNAEDLTLTLLGLGQGIHVKYNHAMFIGGAKVTDYKSDLGTESKYAADNYEMIHDTLGQLFNLSNKGPTSWKWTHLLGSGGSRLWFL